MDLTWTTSGGTPYNNDADVDDADLDPEPTPDLGPLFPEPAFIIDDPVSAIEAVTDDDGLRPSDKVHELTREYKDKTADLEKRVDALASMISDRHDQSAQLWQDKVNAERDIRVIDNYEIALKEKGEELSPEDIFERDEAIAAAANANLEYQDVQGQIADLQDKLLDIQTEHNEARAELDDAIRGIQLVDNPHTDAEVSRESNGVDVPQNMSERAERQVDEAMSRLIPLMDKSVAMSIDDADHADWSLNAKSTNPNSVWTGRAYFDPDRGPGGQIVLFDQTFLRGEDSFKGTFLHELGHSLEYADPKVHDIFVGFLHERTDGEPRQLLRDLIPGSGYRDDEWAWKDDFMNAYMGKDYGDHYTELLSMGLDLYVNNPSELASGDADLYDLVAWVMSGKR